MICISSKELRVNWQIKGVSQVRLVDENAAQLGIVNFSDAVKLAQDRGYDLVEVSPDAEPPVARLMDYGKFKYKQKKKMQKSKKKQHASRLKEIRLRPRTDQHDLDVKFKHVREFLLKGDKVLITMMFRDRERKHIDLGKARLENAVASLSDVGNVDKGLAMEGYKMSVTLTPKVTTG